VEVWRVTPNYLTPPRPSSPHSLEIGLTSQKPAYKSSDEWTEGPQKNASRGGRLKDETARVGNPKGELSDHDREAPEPSSRSVPEQLTSSAGAECSRS